MGRWARLFGRALVSESIAADVGSMISASVSALLIGIFFGALFLRHLHSLAQVAVLVRTDLGEARARRQAALQAWDQRGDR